ncbi:microfibril-associated glycoprotein 4-like [Drosophila innubila]|uniref:microfibril-associated glycoprotein 4-like n=1 Tax=Drosophila innubila TaxID=198719 RepID=UPI00148B6380|nr:microfibril-associated glycoprotein 4-like [Drosophila innubila]
MRQLRRTTKLSPFKSLNAIASDDEDVSNYNDTNLLLSISFQQSKLSDEQDRQGKLIEQLVKKSDIRELQQKLVGELAKILNIQLLSSELERQGKLLLDELVRELDQRHLRYYLSSCVKAKSNGIYDILIPNFSSLPVKVACDAKTEGGGWTVILSRIDGSVDFYRNWTEYQKGFGDLNGEFFLGLDKIHALTAVYSQELLIVLEDFEGAVRYETYEKFAIGSEDQQYVLHTLGKANGTAGDSLSYHRGKKFSTFDRDHDTWEEKNCAEYSTGAWWYGFCHYSNLAGKYKDATSEKGINWQSFKGFDYSLKRAVMMIRPRT